MNNENVFRNTGAQLRKFNEVLEREFGYVNQCTLHLHTQQKSIKQIKNRRSQNGGDFLLKPQKSHMTINHISYLYIIPYFNHFFNINIFTLNTY